MTRIGQSIRPAVVDLTQGVEPASSKKHTAKCKLDNVNERIATWRISEQSLQQRPPKATGNPVNEGPAVEKSNCFFFRENSVDKRTSIDMRNFERQLGILKQTHETNFNRVEFITATDGF